MISRLKALKNRNKQAKSWHYIYVKFPMRLCEINDLRAARRLALSKTDLRPRPSEPEADNNSEAVSAPALQSAEAAFTAPRAAEPVPIFTHGCAFR